LLRKWTPAASENRQQFPQRGIATGVTEQYFIDINEESANEHNVEYHTTLSDIENPFHEMTQKISVKYHNQADHEVGDDDDMYFFTSCGTSGN